LYFEKASCAVETGNHRIFRVSRTEVSVDLVVLRKRNTEEACGSEIRFVTERSNTDL
jgi:hypothetical protein